MNREAIDVRDFLDAHKGCRRQWTMVALILVLSTCGQLGVDAAIMSAIKPAIQQNTPVTDKPLSYAGYLFPPDVMSYAVWLYYRFPLSLRMAEELLAARGITLTHETVRRWAVKFGLGIANAGTREGDAPLQVGATSATICFG